MLVSSLVLGGSVGASAQPSAPGTEDPLSVLRGLTESSTSAELRVLDARAQASEHREIVPSTSHEPISLETPDGTLSIRVGDAADDGRDVGDGLTSYDVHGAEVVPIAKSDGGVQIVSISEDGDPLAFAYEFDVPDGADLHPLDGGGIAIGADVSDPIAVVAAPWAVDAAGESVSTEYVISGTTITQHVYPTAATEFPIVADPYVGYTWLRSYTWENSSRVRVEPTVLLRAACPPGNIPCWKLPTDWLWNELRDVQSATNRSKLGSSEYNQLYCHTVAVPYKSTYNLDTPTPDRGLAGFLANGCN